MAIKLEKAIHELNKMLSECQDFRALPEEEKFLVQAYIIKMRFINHFSDFVPQARVGVIAQYARSFEPPILGDTVLLTRFTQSFFSREDGLRESLSQAFETELSKFAPRPQNDSTTIDRHTASDESFNDLARKNPSEYTPGWLHKRKSGQKNDDEFADKRD